MALKIRNAPGRPGYAHLEFDRDINTDPLRIAVFNLIKREYLGHSVGKPNWTPARAHLFVAPLVERGEGRSVFLVGPEVTTFIPDEATVEITNEDNTVLERAVWSGILLDFHWKGPESETAAEIAKLREAAVKKELDEEVRRQHAEEEARRQREGEEARRRREEEARKLEEEARVRRENEEKAAAARAAAVSTPRSYAKLLAVAAVALVAVVAFWGSQNRDFLCDRFGMFCSAETHAYRAAEACARPKSCGANSCIAEYRRDYPQGRFKAEIDRIGTAKGEDCRDLDREAYDKADACARPLSCGANRCLIDYRKDFPSGRFKAEIDRIATAKGADCRDLDREAYDKADACARPLSCGANRCLTDYRRDYPNGRFKAQIDRIATEKGADCRDLEREALDKAEQCARPLSCGAIRCLTDYRRDYPNGRFKAQIDRIATEKGADCRDLDREAYEKADACARPLSCGANSCLTDYRRDFPNGRFKAEIDRIAAAKGADCRDLEREALDRAEQCARPLTCGANSCLTEYRRDFPNGRYRAQIDRLAAQKGADCLPAADPLPPFNPRPSNQDAGFNCATLRNPEPIEQMICADADLARENAELQRAFDLKIARLAPNERTRLRQEEREWISRRDTDCNIPRSGSWDQMALRRLKTCVIDKTRARRNELQ
jgi:uncharacterized protein YecT (DUF1311 family)